MKNVLILAAGLSVVGCATVTGSTTQSISVQTIQNDNTEIAGAGCTLTNDVGKWFVTTPGNVVLKKSTADLAVECKKDGAGKGHETAVSKANGSVWGNILIGGGIGYIVDRNNGAGFDYPNAVTVVLKNIEQAVRAAPTADSQAAGKRDTAMPATSDLQAVNAH